MISRQTQKWVSLSFQVGVYHLIPSSISGIFNREELWNVKMGGEPGTVNMERNGNERDRERAGTVKDKGECERGHKLKAK